MKITQKPVTLESNVTISYFTLGKPILLEKSQCQQIDAFLVQDVCDVDFKLITFHARCFQPTLLE